MRPEAHPAEVATARLLAAPPSPPGPASSPPSGLRSRYVTGAGLAALLLLLLLLGWAATVVPSSGTLHFRPAPLSSRASARPHWHGRAVPHRSTPRPPRLPDPAPLPATAAAGSLTGPILRAGGEALGLGFDFGTSGARIAVVAANTHEVVHTDAVPYEQQTPAVWVEALHALLGRLPAALRGRINRIAVSGTSASVLLVDPTRNLVTRGPLMYNYNAPSSVVDKIREFAPPGHTTLSASSTLAKLLFWHMDQPVSAAEKICHQADFLAGQLLGPRPQCTSDWNNALKLGYDVQRLRYPDWLGAGAAALGLAPDALPAVVRPGAEVGPVSPAVVERYGLAGDCRVVAGTTDSIAAFIASRASKPGQAVTSLGSTLAIKVLSERPVEDAAFGVYSHRLGDAWLVGGASNVGCAVLRQQNFSVAELEALSAGIDPAADPPTAYYPLTKPGERFPVNDPAKAPVLEPRPASRQAFLHGILHGIARVEAQGYRQLQAMGCTAPTQVFTAGGGSANAMWMAMRQRLLGVPVTVAERTDAAFGVALLALDQAY